MRQDRKVPSFMVEKGDGAKGVLLSPLELLEFR
jgi:hypothetical protein